MHLCVVWNLQGWPHELKNIQGTVLVAANPESPQFERQLMLSG